MGGGEIGIKDGEKGLWGGGLQIITKKRRDRNRKEGGKEGWRERMKERERERERIARETNIIREDKK